jgi:hypothetical protein
MGSSVGCGVLRATSIGLRMSDVSPLACSIVHFSPVQSASNAVTHTRQAVHKLAIILLVVTPRIVGKGKVKFSPLQALEALRVVRG